MEQLKDESWFKMAQVKRDLMETGKWQLYVHKDQIYQDLQVELMKLKTGHTLSWLKISNRMINHESWQSMVD